MNGTALSISIDMVCAFAFTKITMYVSLVAGVSILIGLCMAGEQSLSLAGSSYLISSLSWQASSSRPNA